MATDTKRHSVGGKGGGGPASSSTSQSAGTGPAGAVNMEMALSGAVGSRIRVITAAPTSMTLEGTLFTACPITNLIAINTSPLPPTPITPGSPALSSPSDFHVIPISRIQHFQLISLPPQTASSPVEPGSPFTNAYPTIYPLDLRALKNRESAAVSALQERESRRGKGVTKEAQDIFDAFSRTMPARWDGPSIVVADTVKIAKPYRVEDCRSLMPEDDGGGSGALARVRKVLEMERKKIEFRDASAAIASSSNFPRSHNNANANPNPNPNARTTANATGNTAATPTSSAGGASTANSSSTPAPIPKDRERDPKAAVAVPLTTHNAVRSPPPPSAQRKGG